MYVCVVYADGSICLDILQNRWSPTYDVAAVLTSIQVRKLMSLSILVLNESSVYLAVRSGICSVYSHCWMSRTPIVQPIM